MAGEFLIYLGKLSTEYILGIAPPGSSITLITEEQIFFDFYSRQLAYVILKDGSCLNELLIRDGFAKPMNEYYCGMLPNYQQLNWTVKQAGSGLYSFAESF